MEKLHKSPIYNKTLELNFNITKNVFKDNEVRFFVKNIAWLIIVALIRYTNERTDDYGIILIDPKPRTRNDSRAMYHGLINSSYPGLGQPMLLNKTSTIDIRYRKIRFGKNQISITPLIYPYMLIVVSRDVAYNK